MNKKIFDIKLLLFAIVSAFLHSIAITSFSIPAGLYPGGYSGISRILCDIFLKFKNIELPYWAFYLSLNIITAILVYRKIGKKFAIYSIIHFSLVSLFTSIFNNPLFNLDNTLLYSLFGGILNGAAVGLALSNNFSSGGSDFLSIYYSNKFKKSLWNYILFANIFVLCIAGLLFGWDKALYSIIYQYCSTQVVKSLHKRYTYATITIITSKPQEVADEIQKNIRHGITEIHTHGHYSNSDNTMLYTVVNSFQTHSIVRIVKNVDEHAFINIQNTKEIYGNYYQKPLD